MRTLRISTIVLAGVVIVGARSSAAELPGGPSTSDPSARYAGLTAAEAQQLEQRIDSTVRELGVLETADMVEICSEVPGEVTILSLVPDGSVVKKGDLLVELEASSLHDQMLKEQVALAEAQGALHQAETAVATFKVEEKSRLPAAELALKAATLEQDRYLAEDGEYAFELKSVESQIAVATQRAKFTQAVLSRLVQENEAGRADPVDVEKARLALVEATAALETSQAAKKLLTEHTRAFRSAELELAVVEATATVSRVKRDSKMALEQAEAELRARKIAVELEEERLARLQGQIAKCRIHAPRDGIVVHADGGSGVNSIEEGAIVRERQTILRMPDLSRLRLRVSVHESRIDRVRNGQTAAIRFDAFPERVFRGTVTQVSDAPKPAHWFAGNSKEFDVLVSIPNPLPELKLGMTALAEIDVSPSDGQ